MAAPRRLGIAPLQLACAQSGLERRSPLVIGFSVGIFAPRFLRHSQPPLTPNADISASGSGATTGVSSANSANVSDSGTTSTPLQALDLRSADVAGINLVDTGDADGPGVELQLRSPRPVTVKGAVDDDNVKRVLLDVLGGGDRYCADVRLNAVDCLRSRKNDPDVRSALCQSGAHGSKSGSAPESSSKLSMAPRSRTWFARLCSTRW